jgi:hypothetical protein
MIYVKQTQQLQVGGLLLLLYSSPQATFLSILSSQLTLPAAERVAAALQSLSSFQWDVMAEVVFHKWKTKAKLQQEHFPTWDV